MAYKIYRNKYNLSIDYVIASRYVIALATLSNGNLVSGSLDHTVKIWNPYSGSLLFPLVGHAQLVTALITLSNGNLASGSASW